jgi:hypothetical protein
LEVVDFAAAVAPVLPPLAWLGLLLGERLEAVLGSLASDMSPYQPKPLK